MRFPTSIWDVSFHSRIGRVTVTVSSMTYNNDVDAIFTMKTHISLIKNEIAIS